MTTRLKKPVSRETESIIRSRGKARNIVITLSPHGFIELRLKGCKVKETIPFGKVYVLAVLARVALKKRNRVKRGKL